MTFGATYQLWWWFNPTVGSDNLWVNTLWQLSNGLGQPLGNRFVNHRHGFAISVSIHRTQSTRTQCSDLNLFKNRTFAAGNIATFLSAMSRGGVMIMLVVLLQGIWLPLHGYSYDSAPFWAGIFMIPMSIGIAITGPLSGWLSDKHGARILATAGMVITGNRILGLHTAASQL